MGALLQPKINIHVLIIKNNVCSLKNKGRELEWIMNEKNWPNYKSPSLIKSVEGAFDQSTKRLEVLIDQEKAIDHKEFEHVQNYSSI